jgi:hypothetical protein
MYFIGNEMMGKKALEKDGMNGECPRLSMSLTSLV